MPAPAIDHPGLVRAASRELRALTTEAPGLLGAIVATTDGFEVTAFTSADFTTAKLAAMSSAIHGLGDAVTREAGMDGCRDVIVDSQKGRIVFMSIPGGPPQLLLMAIADQRAALGQLLLACRKCCVAIGVELERAADFVR